MLLHISAVNMNFMDNFIGLTIFGVLQISKALAGSDRKDLMRKLPKFIYDEEKEREVSCCY